MEKGVAAARDPFNAYANDTTLRKTFPGSDWYIGVCSVCGDTFREGDWVYQCPDCKEFFHEDERYALACWSKHRKNCTMCNKNPHFHPKPMFDLEEPGDVAANNLQVIEGFYDGLNSSWKTRSLADNAVEVNVALEGDRAIGKKCPICPHKVRLGDTYVLSPCGCGAYFHSDVIRNLNCWNIRLSNLKNDKRPFCPLHGRDCPEIYAQTQDESTPSVLEDIRPNVSAEEANTTDETQVSVTFKKIM